MLGSLPIIDLSWMTFMGMVTAFPLAINLRFVSTSCLMGRKWPSHSDTTTSPSRSVKPFSFV